MILRTITLCMMMLSLLTNIARTLRIMVLRMVAFSLLTYKAWQNDTINTVCLMAFNTLTNNAGQNDT